MDSLSKIDANMKQMEGLQEMSKHVVDFFPNQLLDDIQQNVRNRFFRDPCIDSLVMRNKRLE